MGLASTQTLGGILDGLMRNTPEALAFIDAPGNEGVRAAVDAATGRGATTARRPPERRPDPSHVIEP